MVTCPDSTSRGHPNTIWDSSRPYFLYVYVFSSSWLVSFIIKWSLLSAFLSSMSYSNKLSKPEGVMQMFVFEFRPSKEQMDWWPHLQLVSNEGRFAQLWGLPSWGLPFLQVVVCVRSKSQYTNWGWNRIVGQHFKTIYPKYTFHIVNFKVFPNINIHTNPIGKRFSCAPNID